MILVQLSDFVGLYQIARSTQNDTLLLSIIDRWEEYFIKYILGATMGEDFITDKSNPTQDPKYAVIEDPFILDDGGSIRVSKGLKDTLTAMIFFKYVSETQVRHSQSGVTLSVAEVSNIQSPENAVRYAEQRWNYALESIGSIQWYCKTYAPQDYPDFNGQIISPEYSAFL